MVKLSLMLWGVFQRVLAVPIKSKPSSRPIFFASSLASCTKGQVSSGAQAADVTMSVMDESGRRYIHSVTSLSFSRNRGPVDSIFFPFIWMGGI